MNHIYGIHEVKAPISLQSAAAQEPLNSVKGVLWGCVIGGAFWLVAVIILLNV
jgi:hypothetical protein